MQIAGYLKHGDYSMVAGGVSQALDRHNFSGILQASFGQE